MSDKLDPLSSLGANLSLNSAFMPPTMDTKLMQKLLGVSDSIMGEIPGGSPLSSTSDGLGKEFTELLKLKPDEMIKKIQEMLDKTYGSFGDIAKK